MSLGMRFINNLLSTIRFSVAYMLQDHWNNTLIFSVVVSMCKSKGVILQGFLHTGTICAVFRLYMFLLKVSGIQRRVCLFSKNGKQNPGIFPILQSLCEIFDVELFALVESLCHNWRMQTDSEWVRIVGTVLILGGLWYYSF